MGAQVQQAAAGVAGRLEDRANEVINRVGDGLQQAADRIEDISGGGDIAAKAGDLAHSAADGMESAARYLRDNDVRSLQGDLERMVREKPLQTLLMGVAAGWLVGKILR